MTSVMQESGMWAPETRSQKSGKESKIENWWEVKRSQNPAEPAPTRGATPLVERCMRVHGFSEGFSKRVLKGYRQFMELKSVMNDWQELKLSPSIPINQMWEQHLLDNLNYTEDCLLLFGRVIGHNPDGVLDNPALQERIMTTKIAFQARYGDDLDQDVWDFGDDWNTEVLKDTKPMKSNSGSEAPIISPRGRLPVASVAGEESASRRSIGGNGGMGDNNGGMGSRGMGSRGMGSSGMDSSGMGGNGMNGNGMGGNGMGGNSMSGNGMGGNGMGTPSRGGVSSRNAPKSPAGMAAPGSNEPITIFLRDSNTGEETYFSLRYKSTLRIVFTVFAERRGLNQDLLKFTYSGQTLTGYETPHSLGLDDRARIDVMIQRRA